jgi:hypothetical protein
MGGCLTEIAWRISYGPADDRLRAFYIPALQRAARYERTAGFFSSRALAVAAAGVAHLVRAGGRMRLLVGASLSEEDVRAVERGEAAFGAAVEARLLEALEMIEADPADPARRRLEVLAWMVAQGTLEMRVVLPTGPDGRPLPAHLAQDYFHPKEGLFTDACGHQLAFSGSVNETEQAWVRNYEQFTVYTSWDASRPYLLQVAARIQRLWEGREESWVALPIPAAVRQRLLRLAPSRAPEADPLQGVAARPRALPPDQRERIVFQFLRDVPMLPGGERASVATTTIQPWPHQARTVADVIRRFPERFLLADEVGLGKTIEAGLALRALLLAGRVRRCLLLVPRSVLRQWQEELYEKFSLNLPAYDGRGFRDYFGELPAPSGNPWDAFPVVLASSQLAKRPERRAALLAAGPWDLVILDEAHHARRREFQSPRYRPNRLLALLEGTDDEPGLVARTRGVLLLTATPMQVHPVEVYDLLRQLAIPPQWAASAGRFLRFFEELRQARADAAPDWGFLLRMAGDGLDARAIDALVAPAARARAGAVQWALVTDLLSGNRPAGDVGVLSPEGKALLLECCRRASPLGQRMFRATRALLRQYRERGLLSERVPERRPEPRWIRLSDEEWQLYRAVEDYVSEFYQRYERTRAGLGFVMTVYRRRLTSSFAALARSLERRRDYLRDLRGPAFGLTDEDTEEADLDEDVGESLEEAAREDRIAPALRGLLEAELEAVERLLGRVAAIRDDAKFLALVDDLRRFLALRDSAAVFTHYTDTLDALRERLVGVYGSRLACYSGRGGEQWDGRRWVSVPKEAVKEAFRTGAIQVLLCTEAASEGLNLQTCGVLVNYDMPWNPMRVEQRIGRFDRIGQRYDDVWIHHYFLEGPRGEETVEGAVYRALEHRIGWFRSVVGELQPILGRIEADIAQAATAPRDERAKVLEALIADLRREIERQEAQPITVDEFAEIAAADGAAEPPPVALRELERALRASSLGHRFRPHGAIAGAYRLDFEGRLWEVTFDPGVADRHPGRVRLLTYGEDLLVRLLAEIPAPVAATAGGGVCRIAGPGIVRWYRRTERSLEEIRALADLEAALADAPPDTTPADAAPAVDGVARLLSEREAADGALAQAQHEGERARHVARAQELLARVAACKAVLEETDAETARRLFLTLGYPWAGLAKVAGLPGLDDVRAALATVGSREQATATLAGLTLEAKTLLNRLAKQREPAVHAGPVAAPSLQILVVPEWT